MYSDKKTPYKPIKNNLKRILSPTEQNDTQANIPGSLIYGPQPGERQGGKSLQHFLDFFSCQGGCGGPPNNGNTSSVFLG